MRIDLLATALLAFVLPTFTAAEAPAAGVLDRLSWMAGSWTGTEDGVEMEEVWTAPKAGSMLGLHRDAAGNRTASVEFLRIEGAADGVPYWASPKGKPATPFKLVEADGRRAVFENSEKEFPRRILYWHTEDGSLHARIEGTHGGKPAAEEWRWKRAAN